MSLRSRLAMEGATMNDYSRVSYRARGIAMAVKSAGVERVDATFPPHSQEDLVFRGGRTLPQLTFMTFYLGKAWIDGPQATARQSLDAALTAALSDPTLNEIVGQYFGKMLITTAALPSAILDIPLQTLFDKSDVETLAQKTYMSGALSAVELDSFVMNFVLPPGAVFSSNGGGSARLQVGRRAAPGTPDKEEEDSKH